MLPDGTVYMLSSSRVADPTRAAMKSETVQAKPEYRDKETITPSFYHVWQIQERGMSTDDDSNESVIDLTEDSDDMDKENGSEGEEFEFAW